MARRYGRAHAHRHHTPDDRVLLSAPGRLDRLGELAGRHHEGEVLLLRGLFIYRIPKLTLGINPNCIHPRCVDNFVGVRKATYKGD